VPSPFFTGLTKDFALPPVFAFDLDGTITRKEILPAMAARLGVQDAFALFTQLTLHGLVDAAASFAFRFHTLKRLPLAEIHDVVRTILLDPDIVAFIRENRDDCVVVTGNLDLWVEPLKDVLECPFHTSESVWRDGKLELARFIDKGAVIRALGAAGRPVVAIGESSGDIPMLAEADIGVVYAGVHPPLPALARLARHTAHDGASLCALLRSLAQKL